MATSKPTIIIDAREQWAWEITKIATVRGTLKTGDYSLAGFEDQVAIERKSLDDLVQTMIRDRERFERELERLRPYRFKCIIIEADLRAVYHRDYRSTALPQSIVGLVLRCMMDYNIPVFFAATRGIAQDVAISFLKRAWNRLTMPERYGIIPIVKMETES